MNFFKEDKLFISNLVRPAMASVLDLSDVKMVEDRMPLLCQMLEEHKVHTSEQLVSLGFVMPTAEFFKRDEYRYFGILPHSANPSRLAAVRELLQNCSDASTEEFCLDLFILDLPLNMIEPLNASNIFLHARDTGLWCPPGVFETFAKCSKFFLCMNGSSKDQPGCDGGFGVGRMVILFGAPLWLLAVRHMLVIGHYNSFKIVCRKCFRSLAGDKCAACGLHESEVSKGTSFLISYESFKSPSKLQRDAQSLFAEYYLKSINEEYFLFCKMKFPIKCGKDVTEPLKISKKIYQGEWFSVSKLEVNDATTAVYVVRTASGVVMFSRMLHSPGTEKGMFAVDLLPRVNYRHFDQARQTLLDDPGVEVSVVQQVI